jgi:hypothetical protein
MNRSINPVALMFALAIIVQAKTAPSASAQTCDNSPGSMCSPGIVGGHGGHGVAHAVGQRCANCVHGVCGGICDCGGDSTCCYCQCGDCGYMRPVQRSRYYNWNRNYAHTEYGQPVSLVVPPTANLQTNYGWGVASSRISRIEHQFQRNYPGSGTFGGPFRPTPIWPSDTTQFGVYYVRGPW